MPAKILLDGRDVLGHLPDGTKAHLAENEDERLLAQRDVPAFSRDGHGVHLTLMLTDGHAYRSGNNAGNIRLRHLLMNGAVTIKLTGAADYVKSWVRRPDRHAHTPIPTPNVHRLSVDVSDLPQPPAALGRYRLAGANYRNSLDNFSLPWTPDRMVAASPKDDVSRCF